MAISLGIYPIFRQTHIVHSRIKSLILLRPQESSLCGRAARQKGYHKVPDSSGHVNLEPAECSSGGVGGSLGGFWTFEDVLGGWEYSQ